MARWLPLESNPEVLNKYMHDLGVPGEWSLCDVYGFDSELLAMLPTPVLSLILLFPENTTYEEFKSKQEKSLKEKGQNVTKDVFFMKQHVGNACGTFAICHAIINNQEKIVLKSGMLKKFVETTLDKSPDERGKALESSSDIATCHDSSAEQGQTQTPGRDDKVDLHFVALVHKDGHLYELDGRKSFPINHGASSPESFVKDAAKVCKEFMARDPDEVHFTVLALTATQ